MSGAAPITLRAGLQADFEAVDAVLSAFPIRGALLGGGTVLAALWDHRDSRDLDLFVPRGVASALPKGTPSALAGRLRERLGAEVMRVGERLDEDVWVVSARLPGGTPLSIHCLTHDRHAQGPPIHNGAVPSLSVADIMRGKLAGRAVIAHLLAGTSHDRPPIRDLYDVAVCAQLAPEALAAVLGEMGAEYRAMAAAAFLAAPPDFHKLDPQPIMNQRFDVDLQGLPQAVGRAVEAGDPGLIPAAARLPNPNGPAP